MAFQQLEGWASEQSVISFGTGLVFCVIVKSDPIVSVFTVSCSQRSLQLAMWLRMTFELLTLLPLPP